MPRHPTPITEELKGLSVSLTARSATGDSLDGAELQLAAEQLAALAERTAPLERFHAELVAEAAEEELRQSNIAADFAGSTARL